MKIVRIFYALSIALLLVHTTVAQVKQQPRQTNVAPAGTEPVLVVESFTHDFGEVKPGDALRYVFKIRNEGKSDLLINSVTPG